MRDERKKQARSNKQQGKATQHTQGSHFLSKKNELHRVGHMYMYVEYVVIIICTLGALSMQTMGPWQEE